MPAWLPAAMQSSQSGDAGQFAVGQHALLASAHRTRLCKLDTFTEQNRAAQQHVRKLIWVSARSQGVPKLARAPTPSSRAASSSITSSAACHWLYLRWIVCWHAWHTNKAELLMVLDRPDTPLHTNGSENDIRCEVTRRKISAGTRSDNGYACSEMLFLGLAKACTKLGGSIHKLPRQSAPNSRSVHRSVPARSRPLPRPASLIAPAARGFADITVAAKVRRQREALA